MKKTFLVILQELRVIFSRKSYLIFAFGIPILSLIILVVVTLINNNSGTANTAANILSEPSELQDEGFVDLSGLVKTVPDDLSKTLFPYATENDAATALEDDEISAYYVIPADYLEKGEIFYVFPNDGSFIADGQDWTMQWTMTYNLLGGNPQLASRVWNPVWNFQTINITPEVQGSAGAVIADDCSRPGSGCESNEFIRMLPSILVVIFYITFMASSSMLFNSIGQEKENRVIEVLMLSISPRQLLAGKTIAMGLAGLTQTLVWMLSIYISLNQGSSTLSLPEGFSFPVGIVLWSIVFFIGGFALYASLMAGAGAMVPKMKEAGIANFIAMAPLLIGYMFGLMAPLTNSTQSGLMVFLSIFPLTSPVVMIMRFTDTVVPIWQGLLSVVLLFASAYYAQWTAANMFHAQNLLSGQPFSLKRYLLALVNIRS